MENIRKKTSGKTETSDNRREERKWNESKKYHVTTEKGGQKENDRRRKDRERRRKEREKRKKSHGPWKIPTGKGAVDAWEIIIKGLSRKKTLKK